MKIATWNVNGLRSSVAMGFEQWLRRENNDVVCLQEAKTQEDLLSEVWFEGYRAYWNAAERRGYSGVVTLVRSGMEVLSVEKGIGEAEIDAEGRVIALEFKEFHLINAYAPHSHRELTLLGKPLIIVGDLNVAHTEKDVANWAQNKKNAGFRPEDRLWMDRLLAAGFVDGFRVFCDEPGHYTWWSPIKGVKERNVGWRLDYILVDIRLRKKLFACYHSPGERVSDHCPVTAEFNL